jgi:hypothetical protein
MSNNDFAVRAAIIVVAVILIPLLLLGGCTIAIATIGVTTRNDYQQSTTNP